METLTSKQVGIWIDKYKAQFIEYSDGHVSLIETIDSPLESRRRIDGESNDRTRFTTNNEHISNNEYRKNNISQNELNDFFKTLEEKVKTYDDILLFGPGKVKEQFRNRLKEHKLFKDKWLALESSDQLTEKQLLAFVRSFFQNSNPV